MITKLTNLRLFEEEKEESSKIRNEKGDINTDITEIEKSIRDYNEQ
jgi:hypothetical protein